MKSFECIDKIEDSTLATHSLSDLLSNGDNIDIASEFPNLVAGFSSRGDVATRTFDSIKAAHELGVHEIFIISMGSRAVGLSVVSRQVSPPEGLDDEAPNLSGFICRPYRGIGLGRISLEKRLEAVDDRFNGIAWTSVRINNSVSNHLVESVGFKHLSTIEGRNIYTYGIKK